MREIRYLAEKEKDRSRVLWETIFPEDMKGFLDYYYSVKTKNNEILAAELDGRICSMIQLNPYQLQIGKNQAECAYVIAVATDERYRHQGMMRELLCKAMKDKHNERQPFLFLIPANPAIYQPFGFRFVMEQQSIESEPGKISNYHLEPVKMSEEQDAADFANTFLKQSADVYAVRDAGYYEVLRKEAKSEDGNISWIIKNNKDPQAEPLKIGLLSYTEGEGIDVREPMLLPEYEGYLNEILQSCFPEQKVHAFGLLFGKGDLKKETIMVRPLYLPALFSGLRAEEDMEIIIRIHDTILAENDGVFVWRVGPESSSFGKEWMPCRQELDLDVSIEALTGLLFGGNSDELSRAEYCIMTPQVRKKWKKIRAFQRVFLNEVV